MKAALRQAEQAADRREVFAGMLSAMGIPVVAGRGFEPGLLGFRLIEPLLKVFGFRFLRRPLRSPGALLLLDPGDFGLEFGESRPLAASVDFHFRGAERRRA